MKVKDIMTKNAVSCSENTNLKEVARLMLENDCGAIPVINKSGLPVGIISDRDIVCRAIAQGKDPYKTIVQECMSKPCVSVDPQMTVEDCCAILGEHQIRRAVVVDEAGRCCGMVSQADIATHNLKEELVEVVEMVSQPHSLPV